VCVGYGLRDEHLNAVIENALGRNNFTMLAFAHTLTDQAFNRWSTKRNVIIVTEARCSFYGDIGPGHRALWDFAALTQQI